MAHVYTACDKVSVQGGDSKPLPCALFALRDTCSARVAEKIRGYLVEKLNETPHIVRLHVSVQIVDSLEDLGPGLILVDSTAQGRTRTFSSRYVHDRVKDQYFFMIGSQLPDKRITQAALEIIAMIKRGICAWKVTSPDGTVYECTSAYGVVAIPKQRPADPDAWKKDRKPREFGERAYYMHDTTYHCDQQIA